MKVLLQYNGSSSPQFWGTKSNICSEDHVWIDGKIERIPFYLTIETLSSIEGIEFKASREERKWGEVYFLDIYYLGKIIHKISMGHELSQGAAKTIRSYRHETSFDVDDGPFARVEAILVTSFRKGAVIRPFDYEVLAKELVY